MKNKNALTRYRLIDNRMTMRHKLPPTLEEIVDYVSQKMGMPISVASIQKDIYAMRYDSSLGFNAPIEYDRKNRRYVYSDASYSISNIPVSDEDLQGLEIAIGILEQFKEIPAIKLFEDAINKIASSVRQSRERVTGSSILVLDRPKRYQGIEYMSDIVEAIHAKNVLRINYQPFTKNEPKKHTVHPYFIKEYNGRMYLIGKDIHPTKESKFLTFSFDRMHDVIRMNQTFSEEEVDKENYFRAAIGISLPNSKPEKIMLKFNPAQRYYLLSQPIHHSQKIVKDTEKEFSISLELVINYELRSLLLSFGDSVKIMKPQRLAEEMKATISRMLAQY